MSRLLKMGVVALVALDVTVIGWLALGAELSAGTNSARVVVGETVPTRGEESTSTASRPRVLFVGDSFPAGSGAATKEDSASCLAASAMEWTCHVDAQAGTGFVANGRASDPSYAALIDRLPRTRAISGVVDVVIVDAGRNDRGFADDQLKSAITAYLGGVRNLWPESELVVIEPYFLDSVAPLFRAPVLDHLEDETKRLGGHVISPQQEGWIDPVAENRNPDAAAHQRLGRRLAGSLRELGLDKL
jgi:hypothetical protein